MADQPPVRTGQSSALSAADAVAQFHAAVTQPDPSLVLFFCSVEFDLDEVAGQMRQRFGEVPLVGCTTAGEFGPVGYRDHTIAGASFSADAFHVAVGRIDDLDDFDHDRAQELVDGLRADLARQAPGVTEETTFGLLLIDGLSVREEPVTAALQNALRATPLVGGSAGDGLAFAKTQVYFDGAFASNRAVVVLVTTELPFTVFKTQHFSPMAGRAVVTSADAERRLIRRIDGLPAAEGYARLVGAPGASLDPLRFAALPVVVLIDGTSYVRSIQKANPDGSLTLFCAIEEGIVLRAARGVDLVHNLEETLGDLTQEIGEPQVVIGCDCVLRKLEIAASDLVDQVEKLYRDNNMIGFNSYGEQFQGVHVNQTLTGIAIGSGLSRDGAT